MFRISTFPIIMVFKYCMSFLHSYIIHQNSQLYKYAL
jgi:hypothetical protein